MFHRITSRNFSWWLGCLMICLPLLSLNAVPNSPWFARAWQTEDGLPEHTIVGLEQTPDGYLWVATHRSLSRFDGMRFHEFSPVTPESPMDHQIRAMLLDRRGRLWLAKDGGAVVCIEGGQIAQTLFLKGTVPGAQAQTMAEDGDGNIWISDSAGILFRIQNDKVQTFSVSDGPTGKGTCWIATDVEGRFWFSRSGHVGIFREGRFANLKSLGRVSSRIAAARQGGVWLFADSKLYRAREEGEIQAVAELNIEPGRAEVDVVALYEDSTHGVWIGTSSGGLFRFDSEGLQLVETTHPNIINIREDSEGNIWVGTRGGGLNRLSPRAVRLLGTTSGLPFAAVRSACEDASGSLWVVGQDGALARRTDREWNLISNSGDWNGGEAACVALETNGAVLIGTRTRGVFRHLNGVITPLPLNQQLTNQSIRALYITDQGDLWLALNSFVVRFRERDGSLKHFPLPPGASDVRTIAEDAEGDVWMGTTSDGLLLRVHDEQLINETTNIMQGPIHIRCLQVSSDGSLWFGFAGQGLGWLKNGRFFQFRSHHGLWDEYISQILSDDQGRLWIAGNKGVFQLARTELEAVAQGRAARLRSVVLGRGDGVANLQATFGISPAATRTADGRLLMPMLNGLVIVEPHLLRENLSPPPVVIERLMVNGKIAASYDSPGAGHDPMPASLQIAPAVLRLEPGVNRMEIEFTGLSLASPENVTFRYQLEGLDQDWVDAGSVRVARYPHVPPGDYRFRVTACNRDGMWNEAGALLAFTVKPQLWEATWFRVTAAIFGAGLLGGAVLLIVRRRYRRKLERLEQRRALERERTRIAQDLHDDLGAGLVEINFGSELAQDTNLNADEVREHTREIGTRAREMVTALDEIVWAVNPKHDSVSSLASYFCQFAQHFLKATPVRCHLDVARNLPAAPLNAEQRHSLFLAFKEALSNVVQHSGATDLRLTIAAHDGTLTISVSDNGRGLNTEASREKNGADGLGNMQRRLQQLGGCCELISEPGKGSTVIFKVPLHDNEMSLSR